MQPYDEKAPRKKRGPLKNKTALVRRKGLPRSTTPLQRTPFKATRRDYAATNPDWPVVKKEVRERSGGRCEAKVPGVCVGKGEHVHHVIRRGQGGPDQPWNLIDTCAPCHRWIHDHPAESYENGWLRRALQTDD